MSDEPTTMHRELRDIDLDKLSWELIPEFLVGRGPDSDGGISGLWLVDADLSRANLRGENIGASTLRNANLTGSDLTGANLRRSVLTAADLSGANLTGVDLTDVVFGNTMMPDGIVRNG